MARSTSQNGSAVTAISRSGSALHQSWRKSLYARTHCVDQLAVAEAQEVAVPEAADVRVEHLGADALLVEEPQTGASASYIASGISSNVFGIDTGMTPSQPAIE